MVTTSASLGSNGGTTTGIDTTGMNFIVVGVSCGSGITPTFSDSKGNTWGVVAASSASPYALLYYCFNPIVGAGHTFTVTSAGGFNGICVTAFHGTINTAAIDQFSTVQTSGTSPVGTSITPSSNNQLVVTVMQNQSATGSYTVDSPYEVLITRVQSNGVAYGVGLGCYVQGTAAATAPTWHQAANVQASIVVASFPITIDVGPLRVSQLAVESVTLGTPNIRASQIAVEAITTPTPPIRTSQMVVEVLTSLQAAEGLKTTQFVVETLTPIVQGGPSVWMGEGMFGPVWVD